MSHNKAPQALLNTVAEFPEGFFLENLAVRSDNSVLVTFLNNGQIWYVPAQQEEEQVEPVHLHTFEQNAAGIVEIEPDVFVIMCSNFYTTHEGFAYLLNLRGWQPGQPVEPELLGQFPGKARGLNGCCLLAPSVLLVADSFASLIWRVDLPAAGGELVYRVWLEHESMGYYPGKMEPEQPGVNGVRFSSGSKHLYFSATAKKLLMRVEVDPISLSPCGKPELVVAGRMGDDFCADDHAKVVYLTTHRQNTLDVVSMDPGLNSGFTQSVAGDPFTEGLIGPSSIAWRRGPGDYGRVAFMTTDGGTASPPPSGPHTAKLLRVTLQPLGTDFPGSS